VKVGTILGLLAAFCLAACATATPDGRLGAYRFDPARDHVGRIFHYLRSNRDGTLPEHIYVFHQSRSRIEVYKMVQRCTNAALVTADLDFNLWSPTRLVGGRLQRDASQQAFAVLTLNAQAPRIDAVVTLPDQEIRQSLALKAMPWRLYDFDFAEFTIFAQHLRDYKKDFSADVALVVTDPGDPQFLKRLGAAVATAQGLDRTGKAYSCKLSGDAFADGGTLLLDARDGHVVGVETAIPNHQEYADFKLALQGIDDGGAPAWRRLLLSHYEGCDGTS